MRRERILLTAALVALLILFAAGVAFGITYAWAADEPPRLYVVPSRDTVYPGQLFTVAITQFGEVGSVIFDAGGLEVLTDTLGVPTSYVWLRDEGPPRDVRVRAWAAGVEASAWVRICCTKAPDAVNPARLMYFPVFRG